MAKETHQGERIEDTGKETYERNIESCKYIFVSWFWLVGILVILAGAVWGASAIYNNKESSQEARIDKNNDGINQDKSDISAGFNALNKRFDDFEKRNDKRLERIENKLDKK